MSVTNKRESDTVVYRSTRGGAAGAGFGDVLLDGLAPDGGLYVPDRIPGPVPWVADRPYVDAAPDLMWPFVAGAIDRETFGKLVGEAYSTFTHPEVIPLVELGSGQWLAELFHGPTLAFKDLAMQLLGKLFEHQLTATGRHVTIIGATSGDTGAAAIEAFRGRSNIDVVILHPNERVSEVQRRQMTTVTDDNVVNLAIDGTFDDCQDLVKAALADSELTGVFDLTVVNSINWGRIVAQTAYVHWIAQRCASDGPIDLVVPTGNFGNIYAARVAQRMGAPIGRLVVATNRNAVLASFVNDASMTIGPVEPSLSPSMDIQVPSNLERLLSELFDDDGTAVARAVHTLRTTGSLVLDDATATRVAQGWSAATIDDDETVEIMAETYAATGRLVDPHTAVGIGAARAASTERTQVVLATAHPAKFPDTVEEATGRWPDLPPHLDSLYDLDEQYSIVPNELAAVARAMTDALGVGSPSHVRRS